VIPPRRAASSSLARRGALVAAVLVLLGGLALPAPAAGDAGKDDGESSAPQRLTPDERSRGAAKYETLYGVEDKKVGATPNTRDDAKFAAKLIELAKPIPDDRPLLAVMYERAHALGSKDPDGYAAALEALELLAKVDPDTAPGKRAKAVELYRLQHKNGRGAQRQEGGSALAAVLLEEADALAGQRKYDDAMARYKEAASVAASVRSARLEQIQSKMKALTERQKTLAKVEKLKARLAASPQDPAAATEVINTYLLELDDPAGAAELAARSPDAKLKQMVPLAAKDPDDVAESELLSLAAWYKALATSASGSAAKAVALARAQDYYTRFVDAHPQKDAERLQATQALAEVSRQLAATATGPRTADRIVVWNTYNRGGDRGAKKINVSVSLRGEIVWSRANIPIEFKNGKDTSVEIPAPATLFDAVRVEVTAWHQAGGGLSEIQVFRGDQNLAQGGAATASSTLDPNYPPQALTDGNTTSSRAGVYWLLKGNTPGWAEVALKQGGGRKR
jgi:hypothetical protein